MFSTIVDSDDGKLDAARNELALSLLELSVIVKVSANNDDDNDCTCADFADSVIDVDVCTSVDCLSNDDICTSLDSVVDIFSISFILDSLSIKSDCNSEEI